MSAPLDGDLSRAVVLVAEDEPDNQLILQSVVEELVGATAVLVQDGTEVLAAVRERAPDLILMDLMMPTMDGFEAARRLREDPATANIPIVAISALARPNDYQEAIAAGCDDFLRKPFQLEELEEVVRHQLGRRLGA